MKPAVSVSATPGDLVANDPGETTSLAYSVCFRPAVERHRALLLRHEAGRERAPIASPVGQVAIAAAADFIRARHYPRAYPVE